MNFYIFIKIKKTFFFIKFTKLFCLLKVITATESTHKQLLIYFNKIFIFFFKI